VHVWLEKIKLFNIFNLKMVKLSSKKKIKLFKKGRQREVSRLFFLRLRLLNSWLIKPSHKLLFAFKRPERYFLKRTTWTYRKFLRKYGKKFFYHFLKKIGVYKHMYLLNKYFVRYKRVWDFKLAKKVLKLRRTRSTLPPHIKYINVPKLILRGAQYFDKNTVKKHLSFSNLVKALSLKKAFDLVNDYRRYNRINNLVLYSLQKNNVRYFIKRNELSGYRVLKYLVLFSKYGNRRKLFSSFVSNCLSSRFNLFRDLDIAGFFNFFSNDVNFAINAFPYNKSRLVYLSFFCRRILFNQLFFYKKKFNEVDIKVVKQTNNNFFLLSNRLLNHFLRLFRIFVEIKPWKKSGRAISVPIPVKSNARRSFIFAHWFKDSVLAIAGLNFGTKVFTEFQSVSRMEGDSIKKLSHLSKSIQSNRALIRKSKLSIV
jgi:hypothetical protein